MSDQALRQFVEQIERTERERKALSLDISEFYKAAKHGGYDVKVLRRVIQERRKGTAERQEQDALFEAYWNALAGAPAREEDVAA